MGTHVLCPTWRAFLAVCLIAALCPISRARSAQGDLEQQFRRPPDSAKPWAYWWWLDSNASKEGITRDLEEMRRQGIGGVLIFDAGIGGPNAPNGPVFMSQGWRELFRFAVAEAHRLGLEVSINLCSGWNAGGTWVQPEHAAQKLVWSQTSVRGPAELSQILPQPPTVGGYFRNVAVLAFPTTDAGAMPKLTASSSYPKYPPDLAADGDPKTRWISNGDKPGQGPKAARPEFLTFEYGEPFPAASLHVIPYPDCGPKECELQSSADGKSFQTICRFSMEERKPKTVTFGAVRSRFFRLMIVSSYPFRGQASWNVQIGEIALLRKGQKAEIPKVHCESQSVVDLTGKMDAAGRLMWQTPEGSWMILRLGHTLVGARTKCTSPGSQGYEIDPLSAEAMDMHFAATAGKLVADIGPLVGKTLKYTHIDSWELAGNPNWSPRFRDEFKRRRGYDLLPYLPALANKIVDSPEVSERFRRDVRRTLSDCIAENYYGRLRELSRRHGMGIHPESGGPCAPATACIDALQVLGKSDIPMGEFWARKSEPAGPIAWGDWTIKQAASAAHIYGKRLVQAEAFTTMGPNWEKDPFMLKGIGDHAFCCGVNRAMLCFYVHQPRADIKPGCQWEAAGTHFDRNITWWPQIHAWLSYLSRCQFLLQQGLFVADVCYFYGEDTPIFVPAKGRMRPLLPRGYDYDVCNAEVLLTRMSAREGRIVLPDGMSYHLLVLPERQTMGVEVLKKVVELVAAGATVVGPKPLRAPGLTGYPDCDRQVRELAQKLWGPCDGRTVKERRFGKGRIIWGRGLHEILSTDGRGPDFQYASGQEGARLDYIHRRQGDTDIYFVSNQRNRFEEVICTFRVSGKAPELWMPDTGKMRPQVVYDEAKAGIALPLRLGPRGSVFVVFRKPRASMPAPVVALTKDGQGLFPALVGTVGKWPQAELLERKGSQVRMRVWQPGRYELKSADGKTAAVEVEAIPEAVEIAGPWRLTFPEGWGAPKEATFEKLIPWNEHPEDGIKYFSGTATYHKTFGLPQRLRGKILTLDLGHLKNVAEVKLNGRELGVLWKPPFRVDVTGIARPGRNQLEIKVTNLWPNRLIGDSKLPPEKRFTSTNVAKFYNRKHKLLESGLIGPVRIAAGEAVQARF